MSLTGSLLSAVSGLQTTQRQMQVTSGNVANANVDGYSRKTASARTVVVGGQNGGVDLGQVTRQVNSYLTGEVRRSKTELGALEAKDAFLDRITQMFGTLDSDSTLTNAVGELSSAMEALALDPESTTVRNDVVEVADELVRQFNRFSGDTQNLRVEADRQIDQGVRDANKAMTRIAELNAEISRGLALNEPVGDLEDERDRQLGTLSELIDIRTFERSNGEIAVVGATDDATTSGTDEAHVRTLVDSKAAQFDFTPANALDAAANGNLPRLTGDADVALNASAGGKLGQLIEMRDDTLTKFHAELDRLSAEVRDRINAAHNRGTFGNEAQAGISGTTDVSADTLTGAAGTLTINEVDAASGEVTASNTVSLGAVGSFSDLTAALTAGNVNAAISGGELQLTSTDPSVAITLDTGDATITGDYGTRNLSHYFGLNDLFASPGVPADPAVDARDVTDASGRLQLRADIKADSALLSRGTARSGAGENAVAGGDNSVAQAMSAAFDTSATIPATGHLSKVTATLGGYAGDILALHADSTARTGRELDFQKTLHSELKFRAESESGVNIDEELSNIVLFEQAYNASARVISTVQDMFDTLDRMIN